MAQKTISNKIFHLTSSFKKSYNDDDGSITISGLASTNATDRANDIIQHSAWDNGLENFKNNPIILFNHNYNKPIGRATDIKVTAQGLELTARISKSAGEVYDLIKEGILVAFSVGFMIVDADYNRELDAFIIKEAELYEVSVVTVPCNQTALFSVSKSFDDAAEYEDYKSVYLAGHSLANKEVIASGRASDTLSGANAPMEKKRMDPDEIKALIEKTAKDTAAKIALAHAETKAKAEADAKAAAEAAAKKEAEDKALVEKTTSAVTSGMKEGAESLYAEIEKRLSDRDADAAKILNEMKSELESAKSDLARVRDSKRVFGDRGTGDWKTDKSVQTDIEDAFVLSLATRKGFADTKMGREVIEKVNAMSGVTVSSADFEQLVSTNVERDIQNELILAPLFRPITLTSATQILPIMPDAGYAEITGNQVASGSNPNGNLDARGATFGSPYGGVPLSEVTLSTVKLISQSYLGNETEEDAILPILPLIRDAIVRSHARGVENALLAGNHADGVYSSGAFDGLIKLASTNSRTTQSATAFASYTLTAAQLLAARKALGKYGIRPKDVVYIVSQRGYFELLEDAEFQDWNIVGSQATKLTGEVGEIFGSKVMLCDEFAAPAVSKYHALAVNTRNFLVPRLRGFRMESDYETANQRTVVVGSQRMGFKELIADATAVHGLQYKAS